ncbi:MAG: LysM peptidoglycan-binding domain-containing protein [Bacteroidetes bacterium]|nr:MAG: LysM peptidoglycan-binding domain-containing protein [Bacteroidota bacterium]
MNSKVRLLSILFFLPLIVAANGGRKINRAEYIAMYKNDAINDMKKMGVPASITMAQALLESSDGNSNLARLANNHFGIKCSDWKGPSYIQDDDTKDECFRKYNSVLESYDDHSNFLRTRPRYAFLFELDIKDYKGWAKGLKKAGYATDPTYADRLIKIIEDNELYLLDNDTGGPAYASNTTVPVIEEKPNNNFTRISVPAVEVVEAFESRQVKQNNGVNYIIAREGDTFEKLAHEFELGHWQLPKYNEMESDQMLAAGQRIYLQPKKSTGTKALVVVKDGDTIHSIAQSMGIKVKYLCRYNDLEETQALKPGQKIYLKKRS